MATTLSPYVGATWQEWLVFTNDVGAIWRNQPTYLISQALITLGGLVTFVHALKKGGRWPWLLLAILLHGLWTDNIWHFVVPEFDNFWHSQSTVMILDARQPLHICFFYMFVYYNAIYAVSRLNMPSYAEPFLVGLLCVLVDLPYDIVSVRFLHWTWHDTDPNIFDRHYWVPWTSYYFHATFAGSFYFIYQVTRKWLAPKVDKWESAGVETELKAVVASAALGMAGGVLLFLPVYHPLHDSFGVHSEVTVFILVAAFLAVAVNGFLADRPKPATRLTAMDMVMLLVLAAHFVLNVCFVVWGHPELERSVGKHEPVGPCDQKASLVTPFGHTLWKRKFFCPQDYDEGYFDFSCVGNQLPPAGSTWYTLCGVPFGEGERAEYIAIISSVAVFAFGIFYAIYKVAPAATPTHAQGKKVKTK